MTFDRQLVLQEITVPPSSEWATHSPGWTLVRLGHGVGYWRQRNSARELGPAQVVVFAQRADATIRASQLGPVKLQFFSVQPELLRGILTWPEQNYLNSASVQSPSGVRFLPATSPLSQRFARLCEEPCATSLSLRCQLLQLWVDLFAVELGGTEGEPAKCTDAKGRFRQFINQIPEAELQDRSIDELARLLRCSPRHLSRLFHEEFGVPLRAKQTELRLLKARQLLADSNAKVINVALDSGYRHLGLFNSMFKKHFGMTPTEWRRLSVKKSRPPRAIRL